MTMEPTLAMSFDDMIIRVSEVLGVGYYGAAGDSAAAAPTDTHDLDMVKRIVNDGWRRFCTSHPRGWNWMTPNFALTFDSEGTTGRTVESDSDQIPRAARYYMPHGFYGQFIDQFTYGPDGPRVDIELTDESHIRSLYATSGSTTGDPVFCAVRPLPTSTGSAQPNGRWEVIFYPTPSSDISVVARLRLWPNKLVNTTDRHAAGFQFDEAVLAACMAEAEQQRDKTAGVMTARWAEALARAIVTDNATVPRTLGYCGGSKDYSVTRRNGWYNGVDSYINLDGTTHTFT